MTQEEKAKAYDDAIKRAKRMFSEKELNYLFPELAESDDEKIISAIRKAIEAKVENLGNGVTRTACLAWLEKQEDKDSQVKLPTFTFDDILALQCCMETVKKVQEDKDLYEKLNDLHGRVYDAYHLEKQGEQKPANKVEPKFKVGDYVVDNCGYVWRIEGIINQFYILEGIDGGESRPTIEWVNKTFHLWTIQDAKDGDVLVHGSFMFDDFIFIYNNTSILQAYCYYSNEINRFIIEDRGHHCPWNMQEVTPASKEQCDLLFQKMKEAGYEWNAEKKELKEIENEEYDGEDYGIDSLWHAKNILEKTLGKVDGYQTDDGILDHKCAISAVNKLCKEDAKITNRWNPSDEHIHWLKWVINRMPDTEKANEAEVVLKDLLEQLEEL